MPISLHGMFILGASFTAGKGEIIHVNVPMLLLESSRCIRVSTQLASFDYTYMYFNMPEQILWALIVFIAARIEAGMYLMSSMQVHVMSVH